MKVSKPRSPGSLACLVAGALLLGAPTPARADVVAPAAAQTLFDEARGLMAASRFSEACPKLAESQRLEPASGTLLNLAVCYEHEGKTASAWLEYHDVLALALREKNAERRQIATERIEVLEPQLSKLKVNVPARVPTGFWVTVDQQAVGPEALSASFPVDPGVHRIRYGAPGYEPAALAIDVRARGKVSAVALTDLRRHVGTGARNRENASRTGWAFAGAGFGVAVAAFGAAAYLGIRANDAWDERNRHCADGCDAVAVESGRNAQHLATAADIALVVGVLGAAVGTYFLVSTLKARVDVGANGRVGLVIGGSL